MTVLSPASRIFFLAMATVGLVEVVGGRHLQAQVPPIDPAPSLPPAYWEAIEDARVAEPSEIFTDLTAVVPYNDQLIRDERDRVLVVTWTDWDGYRHSVGNHLVLTQEVWVTVAPDLQEFCRAYAPTAEVPLAARLNQLLGLPPNGGELQIVELWVDPQYLFRPSPDPEITDHEAELDFRTASEFVTVPPSYQHWFYTQYDQLYQQNGRLMTPESFDGSTIPYPWTRLGYTYDWGNPADWAAISPGRPADVGLSEFLVRQWSPIAVRSAQSAEAYCQ